MQWLNSTGAWAFLALAAVIALYVLRKKAKRVPTPSLLIWRKTEGQSLASKPFQRLRSRLLLWLQLLLAILLAVALMRPVSSGGSQGEAVLIFDLSASMQTLNAGKTRLDEAKEAAGRMLDGLRDEDAVTVLLAGSTLQQSVSRSTDHAAVRRVIQGLRAENGAADVEAAVSLAQAMRRDLPGLRVIVYSDTWSAASDDVEVDAVGTSVSNRSLLSLRLSLQETDMTAFAQIENRGEALTAELECYADGTLCDVRTAELPKDEKTSVRFSVPLETQRVMVRFAQPDALAADDARYAAKPVTTQRRALLVTSGNVFLERALSLDAHLTVVKAAPEDAPDAGEYDLYIYDGALPETLPESGAVLAIAPDREILGLTPGEEKTGGGKLRSGAGSAAEALCENLTLSEIALKTYRPLLGGQTAVAMGEDALLSVNEADARRVAALAFDLHDSNLPLKADFPVLIQNLLGYLLPDAANGVQDAACGESLAFTLNERTVAARVSTPSGRSIPLKGATLADTDEIGLYTLTEEREDGSARETAFALHPPAGESDTLHVASSSAKAGETGRPLAGGREWTVWVLLACFAVLLLEWEVSRRGT